MEIEDGNREDESRDIKIAILIHSSETPAKAEEGNCQGVKTSKLTNDEGFFSVKLIAQ